MNVISTPFDVKSKTIVMKSYGILAVFHALSNYYAGCPSPNPGEIPDISDTFLKSLLKILKGTSVVFVLDIQENIGSNEMLTILLKKNEFELVLLY